jgi:hypothetical protein
MRMRVGPARVTRKVTIIARGATGGRFASYTGRSSSAAAPSRPSYGGSSSAGSTSKLSASDLAILRIDDLRYVQGPDAALAGSQGPVSEQPGRGQWGIGSARRCACTQDHGRLQHSALSSVCINQRVCSCSVLLVFVLAWQGVTRLCRPCSLLLIPCP